MEIKGTVPTEAEINAAAEEQAKKPCACCGFPLGMRSVSEKRVDRIEFGPREGTTRGAPLIESLHEKCYEYTRSYVDRAVKIERERKVG